MLEDQLVEVGTAQEVAAGTADELAAAVLQPGGAGGAEDAVVFVGNGTGGDELFCYFLTYGRGRVGQHCDRVSQMGPI